MLRPRPHQVVAGASRPHPGSRGYLAEGGVNWRIALMRPGADPLSQLAEALNKALGPDAARLATLRRSSFGLHCLPWEANTGRKWAERDSTKLAKRCR
jgi:hypothetical protein